MITKTDRERYIENKSRNTPFNINLKNKLLNVKVLDDKLDLDFELSSDTKFTLRTLLSFCLFVIVVFHYHIHFKFLGVDVNGARISDLAQLSLILIVIHVVLFGIYLYKDIITFNKKKIDINKKIKELSAHLNPLYQQTHDDIVNSYHNSNMPDDELNKSIEEFNRLDLDKEIRNSEPYVLVDKEIKHYKSLLSNTSLIVWGVHIIYPFVAVGASIFLLANALLNNNLIEPNNKSNNNSNKYTVIYNNYIVER